MGPESPNINLNPDVGNYDLNNTTPVAPPRSPKTLKMDTSKIDNVDLSGDANESSAKLKTPDVEKDKDNHESSKSFLSPLRKISSKVSSKLSSNDDEQTEYYPDDDRKSAKSHSSKRDSGIIKSTYIPATKEEENLSAKMDSIIQRGLSDADSIPKVSNKSTESNQINSLRDSGKNNTVSFYSTSFPKL